VTTMPDAPRYTVYTDLYKKDPTALAALNDQPLAKPAAAPATTAAAKPGAKQPPKPGVKAAAAAKPKPATVASNR